MFDHRQLQIANHAGKFAKNLAETTKPLRDLLRKDTAWIWDEPQKTTFQTLKKKNSTAPVLIHYNAERSQKFQLMNLPMALVEYFSRNKKVTGDLHFMPPDSLHKLSRDMLKLKKKF